MKRLASILVLIALFLTVGSSKSWAQRSGSLQATAQVIDTRAAVSGLSSAQSMAAEWAAEPTRTAAADTGVARISLVSRSVASDAGRPESQLEIRVDYLRN